MVPVHINETQLQCDFGEGTGATLVACSAILCTIDFNGSAPKNECKAHVHAFLATFCIGSFYYKKIHLHEKHKKAHYKIALKIG